jgi:hypothetical protein
LYKREHEIKEEDISMSKLPNSNSETGDNNSVSPTEDRPPGTPRWVKVSGIIIIALVLLFVILQLTGVGGNHGPGMHGLGVEPTGQIEQEAPGNQLMPKGDQTPSGGIGAHKPPGGGH